MKVIKIDTKSIGNNVSNINFQIPNFDKDKNIYNISVLVKAEGESNIFDTFSTMPFFIKTKITGSIKLSNTGIVSCGYGNNLQGPPTTFSDLLITAIPFNENEDEYAKQTDLDKLEKSIISLEDKVNYELVDTTDIDITKPTYQIKDFKSNEYIYKIFVSSGDGLGFLETYKGFDEPIKGVNSDAQSEFSQVKTFSITPEGLIECFMSSTSTNIEKIAIFRKKVFVEIK